VINQTKHCV